MTNPRCRHGSRYPFQALSGFLLMLLVAMAASGCAAEPAPPAAAGAPVQETPVQEMPVQEMPAEQEAGADDDGGAARGDSDDGSDDDIDGYSDDESDDDRDDYSDEGPSLAPQPCLNMRNIRRLEGVGDHSILFYAGRGDVWRNRLRQRCASMRRGITFSYELRGNRLCSGDIISVVDDFGGRFEMRGRCLLGEFEYLTEDQAEIFKGIR